MPEAAPDWPKLVALAAHELRTPINVVVGYLRMLRQGQAGTLAEAQQALIDAADRSTLRIVELLGELADLAAIESGGVTLDRRTVALDDLVRELASPGGASAESTVELLGPVPDVLIDADAPRLRAALAALARASRRRDDLAEPVGLRSWVAPERDQLDISIVLGPPATVAALEPGIRAPWHAFDCWRGGHGLALVLAVRVVAWHDGAVWTLATRPGRTATLVRLPASATRAA